MSTATTTNVKLSKETLAILKNFASINSNIMVFAGNTLKTISNIDNVMGYAVVPETFPIDFGIHDLNQFLSTYSLMDNPELIFENAYMILQTDRSSAKYFYSPQNLLKYPTQDFTEPEWILEFPLSQSDLKEIVRASSVLSLPNLIVDQSAGDAHLRILDKKVKQSDSNDFTLKLDNASMPSEDFQFDFLMETLSLLPGDYTVSIAEQKAAMFQHSTLDLKYYIALEDSSYV